MNSILKIDKKRFKDIKMGGGYYMKVIMFRKLEFIIYIELWVNLQILLEVKSR